MNIIKNRYFLSLIVAVGGISVSAALEGILALFLILSVGLLHGSNDLMVIQRLASYEQINGLIRRKTLLAYIGLILIVLILFSTQRQFALLFFVLISSFHFGQQHWHRLIKEAHWIRYVFYTSYGLLIFGLLFWTHSEQSSLVIEAITSVSLTAFHFMGLSVVAFGLTVLMLIATPRIPFRFLLMEVGALVFLFMVFRYTSYYSRLHSIFHFGMRYPRLKIRLSYFTQSL